MTEPLYPLHSGFGTVGGRPPKQQRRRQEANQDDYPQSHQTLPDPPNADKRFWFRDRICRSDLRRGPPCSTTHAGRPRSSKAPTAPLSRRRQVRRQPRGLLSERTGCNQERATTAHVAGAASGNGPVPGFVATLPVVCRDPSSGWSSRLQDQAAQPALVGAMQPERHF